MFILFFCTKSNSQISEAPIILKGLLMTSSKLLSLLTQILSVNWKNRHDATPTPHPPVLTRLDGMLTKIKSNIYVLHNLYLLPFLKGDIKF